MLAGATLTGNSGPPVGSLRPGRKHLGKLYGCMGGMLAVLAGIPYGKKIAPGGLTATELVQDEQNRLNGKTLGTLLMRAWSMEHGLSPVIPCNCPRLGFFN